MGQIRLPAMLPQGQAHRGLGAGRQPQDLTSLPGLLRWPRLSLSGLLAHSLQGHLSLPPSLPEAVLPTATLTPAGLLRPCLAPGLGPRDTGRPGQASSRMSIGGGLRTERGPPASGRGQRGSCRHLLGRLDRVWSRSQWGCVGGGLVFVLHWALAFSHSPLLQLS